MGTHLKLHATQLKQLTQTKTHPLHDFNAYSHPPRNMKSTIFHNNDHTNIIILDPDITPEECKENLTHTHCHHLIILFRKNNQGTNTITQDIYQNKSEQTYHITCTKFAQLKVNQSIYSRYLH